MTLPPLDVLLSYAFHSKTDLHTVRQAIGPDALLLVDSGAFTAHSTGKPISREAYAEYLGHYSGAWSAAVSLDVIGDVAATRRNTAWLHARGLAVMPVHTVGAPLAEFDAAVKETGYVAVGGMVGTARESQAAYLRMLIRRAREHGGSIHALGVARPALIRQTRPYSSDVSTVSRTLLHGGIALWNGRKAVAVRVHDGTDLRTHLDLLRAYGLDVGRMSRRDALGKEYRPALVKAACWSTILQGVWQRAGAPLVPVPPGVVGLPGPRLCTALVTREITEAALLVATDVRAGRTPRIVQRLLPRGETT